MSYELTYIGQNEPVVTIMHTVRVEWGDDEYAYEEDVVIVETQFPKDEFPYSHSAWDWAQFEPSQEVIDALGLISPRAKRDFLQECLKVIEQEAK